MQVKFILIKDIYDFNHLATNISCEAHLTQDSYRVNAKSLLGLFALDLTKPITLELEDESAYAFFKQFEV